MKIILPKHYVDAAVYEPPRVLFFLAGPIRGGGDWQRQMAEALRNEVEDCVIACPSRWTSEHALAPYFFTGDTNRPGRQLDWEERYLMEAGLNAFFATIVFWLPLESEEHPHPGPEPYAMDTRRELGEWGTRLELLGARVVIGADPKFLGLSQIQRSFNRHAKRTFPIHSSMEETAKAALLMARCRTM